MTIDLFRVMRDMNDRVRVKLLIIAVLCSLGVIGWHNTASAQETATGFVPITVDNISQLELGYALPGWCNGFSPDGTLLIARNDVYDVRTGQLRFETHAYTHTFSNDGTLLAADEDGVYDVATGIRLFETPNSFISEFIKLNFSPDGTMVVVSNFNVLDTSTGEELFLISGYAEFSPDGLLLAVYGDGVYEVSTRERVFELPDYTGFSFSPDSSLLAVPSIGVYETATWQLRFAFSGVSGALPVFSPDSRWVAVAADAVYDTVTGERSFPVRTLGYNSYTFSPDSSLLAISQDAIYSTENWAHRFDISSSVTFSPDGTMYSLEEDGIYRMDTGAKLFAHDGEFNPHATLLVRTSNVSPDSLDSCLIYGSPETAWAFRSGLVRADSPVNLHFTPNGELRSGSVSGEMPVLARTSDANWFRVGAGTWVSASVVQIISMPDDVPVENP